MKEDHAFVYSVRNELLKSFGFRTYKEYLKSDEWKAIRSRVLSEYTECICCDKPSSVVHHVRYDSATLLGLHSLHLAPLCRGCHEKMEITVDGDKASLGRANTLMFDMARKKNAKQVWLKRFYTERKSIKGKRAADVGARRSAWERKRREREEKPRDYSGVFWIRARKR